MLIVNDIYRARFHSKTEPGSVQTHMDTACVIWGAAKNKKGYGRFYAGTMTTAHRYAYLLAHGEIASGAHVLHRCDVRACVNPEHLYLGSNDDNVADRVERTGYGMAPSGEEWQRTHAGRMARGVRWHETHDGTLPKGEAHHLTTLTEDDVRAIRAAYTPRKNGGVDAIAARYGVDRTTIHNVVSGKTWGHVV